MSNKFVILFMVFCHIVDDYYLQGILASMKQKQWWKDNAPQSIYEWDYIVALAMHSMSWGFMIMLPIAFAKSFDIGIGFVILFFVNAVIHGIVDDLKANKKLINLVIDQSIHIIQISFTAVLFMIGVI